MPYPKPRVVALALAAALVTAAPTWAGPLSGTVVDGNSLEPVAGARVEIAETGASAVTDEAGRYALVDAPEGAVTLRVTAAGYAPSSDVVALPAEGMNELVTAVFMTGAVEAGEAGETIVIIERSPTPKTTPGQAALAREELVRLPGTRGDAVASIKSLPGVANADAVGTGPGLIVIRGAAPEDSVYLLDNAEIPLVYHFFGLQSILPSEFIDDIEFLPGGFGAEQGRATGGIVSIRTRPSRAKEFKGFAELSFINVAGYLEGPLWKEQHVNLTLAFRRSLIDFVVPAVIPDDVDLSFTTAPRYYDGQLRLDWIPDQHNRVSLLALGSFDLLSLVSDEENPNDPVATGTFENETTFTRALASWDYERGAISSRAAVSAGGGEFRVDISEQRFLRGTFTVGSLREDLAWRASDRLTLRTGGEAYLLGNDLSIKLPLPPQEGDPDQGNLTTDPLVEFESSYYTNSYSVWLAADVMPTPELRITPGVRLDYYQRMDEGTVSPRLSASYELSGDWTLRAALGSYSRPLGQAEAVPTDLKPELATQYIAGVDCDLSDGVSVSTTGFYTDRRQLIVQDERLIMGDDPLDAYVSRGWGHSYGGELLLRAKRDDFFGWIAYTLSKSERVDGPGEDMRLFDYDQTHNFIAVGSYTLGKWELGGRWQYTTGEPETPVIGSTYLADFDAYVPRFGAVNSGRIEAAHQLDLRVDRYWQFDTWKLSAFLDVTNVYAHARTLGYQYSFDYSEREAFESIPIFPAIGVRGSF